MSVQSSPKDEVKEYYECPEGFTTLFDRISGAETVEDWSKILSDYLSWGNTKICDKTAIFNLNSAHDCPNRETQEKGESETGLCQVPWDLCYAGKSERTYKQPLDYRRRQEFLWDCIDPQTFAEAFVNVIDRKIKYGNLKSYSEVDLRFSEAGDFRTEGDIYKADHIADILHSRGVGAVYTYSASYKISAWFDDSVNNLIVMQSVSRQKAGNYGDKEYVAFELSNEDIEESEKPIDALPDGTVWCPHDLQKRNGLTSEEAIKCGECRLCLQKEGPDVAIPIHK